MRAGCGRRAGRARSGVCGLMRVWVRGVREVGKVREAVWFLRSAKTVRAGAGRGGAGEGTVL